MTKRDLVIRISNDTGLIQQDVMAVVQKTLDYINEFKPSQIDGSEEKTISLPMGGETRTFKGENYLVTVVLPNFYFHVTTTYAILRHNGVELGKGDYLRPPA